MAEMQCCKAETTIFYGIIAIWTRVQVPQLTCGITVHITAICIQGYLSVHNLLPSHHCSTWSIEAGRYKSAPTNIESQIFLIVLSQSKTKRRLPGIQPLTTMVTFPKVNRHQFTLSNLQTIIMDPRMSTYQRCTRIGISSMWYLEVGHTPLLLANV